MKREIPFKNYIFLAIILILSILLVIYFYMWHSSYEKSNLNTPILDDCLQVLHYNELDNYLVENKNAVFYTSVLQDPEIRNFEKKFKRFIYKYSLNNSILYLDVTDELENDKLFDEMGYENVPYIAVVKDGKLVSAYSIKDNNYNLSLLKDYLVSEGIMND